MLWFLRKHAPVQLPAGGLESVASVVEEAPMGTSSSSWDGSTVQPKIGSPCPTRPQREFLYRALVAIGSELDEGGGRLRSVQRPMSVRHRECLRQLYTTHSDAERDQLQAAVATREAEILSLKKQLQHLEQSILATRMAAENRSRRLRSKSPSDHSCTTSLTVLVRKQRSARGKSFAESTLHDAEAHGTSNEKVCSEKADRVHIHDLEQSLTQLCEVDAAMREQLKQQSQLLHQQTVLRKATEAGLFAVHAQILRSRAQALRTEARVTRLANELRRVYSHLPQVVQQLQASSSTAREQAQKRELAALRAQHRAEHFKFMDGEALLHEQGIVERQIEQIKDNTQNVTRALRRGDLPTEVASAQLQTVQVAVAALQKAWGGWTKRAREVPEEASMGKKAQTAQELLHKAAIEAAAIEELLALAGEAESGVA